VPKLLPNEGDGIESSVEGAERLDAERLTEFVS
jgi:hypothetical protein